MPLSESHPLQASPVPTSRIPCPPDVVHPFLPLSLPVVSSSADALKAPDATPRVDLGLLHSAFDPFAPANLEDSISPDPKLISVFYERFEASPFLSEVSAFLDACIVSTGVPSSSLSSLAPVNPLAVQDSSGLPLSPNLSKAKLAAALLNLPSDVDLDLDDPRDANNSGEPVNPVHDPLLDSSPSHLATVPRHPDGKKPVIPLELLFTLYSFWAVSRASYARNESPSLTHGIALIPLKRPLHVFARVLGKAIALRNEAFKASVKPLGISDEALDSFPPDLAVQTLRMPKAIRKEWASTGADYGLFLVGGLVSLAKLLDSCLPSEEVVKASFHPDAKPLIPVHEWRTYPPSLVGMMDVVFRYLSRHLNRSGFTNDGEDVRDDTPSKRRIRAQYLVQYARAMGLELYDPSLPAENRDNVETLAATLETAFVSLRHAVNASVPPSAHAPSDEQATHTGQAAQSPHDKHPDGVCRDGALASMILVPFYAVTSEARFRIIGKLWRRSRILYHAVDATVFKKLIDKNTSIAYLRRCLDRNNGSIEQAVVTQGFRREALEEARERTSLERLVQAHPGLLASTVVPAFLKATEVEARIIYAAYAIAFGADEADRILKEAKLTLKITK